MKRAGPHLSSGESGYRILWTQVVALWLVVVVSVAFFGWSSLLLLGATVTSCVAVDLAMSRLVGARNPSSLPHAVLMGLLLGLSIPVMTDTGEMLRIGIVGALVTSLLGKWIFGGMGHYLWHPALVGILALHLLFPTELGKVGRDEEFGHERREEYLLLSNSDLFRGDVSKNQSAQFYHFGAERGEILRPNNYHGWSRTSLNNGYQAWRLYRPAQILGALAEGQIKNPQRDGPAGPSAVEQTLFLALPPLSDAIVGCTGGGLGETSVVAILLGGLFLIYRGYVRWQLPVSFLAAAAVSAAVMPLPIGSDGQWVWLPAFSGIGWTSAEGFWRSMAVGTTYVGFHLCSGGLMLAAFFLANGMATRPRRLGGQVIFAVCAGVLTIAARCYGGWRMAPLAAYGALLVMNTFTPLIDWITRRRSPAGKRNGS